MTRRIRKLTLMTLLTLGGGLLLSARPALAQGPYGRNSYADFPFNQGSLFYRPLKPAPKPKPAPRPAPHVAGGYTYTQGGYTYTYPQANTYPPQQRGYYYPANPGYAQPYPVAPRPPAPPAAAPAAPR